MNFKYLQHPAKTLFFTIFCLFGLPTRPTEAASEVVTSHVIIVEAENFISNIPRGSHSWSVENSVAGFTGSGYMQSLPDTGSNIDASWTSSSPELQYSINFPTAAIYHVWARGYPIDDNDNSFHAGLNGTTGTASRMAWTTFNTWSWTNGIHLGGFATIEVGTAGLHTFNLWMREDGTRIDRIALSTNPAFRARPGNAWHIPSSVEATIGQMRQPLNNILSNAAVTIFSGNQYQGAGEAGNQLADGTRLYYRNATGSVWTIVPMSFQAVSGNNSYFAGTIPSNSFAAGATVQYYIRIPYSDFLPTYLCSVGGNSFKAEDEQFARANPFTYTVYDPTQTNAPSGFASPDDWRDQNIYFIFTDRFNDGNPANNNANLQSSAQPGSGARIHGGDFKGIQNKLDYIKALGATAIWITPIPQNVGHSGYHGYGADNFYQLQPNWGTLAELSNMVAAAHAKGIYVILDVVANHAGNRINSSNAAWNSTFSAAGYPPRWSNINNQHPLPFNQLTNFHNNGSIGGNYVDPNQILGELSGLDDLRTETAYVRTNLVEIYKYWIQAADFDGFRLDTVKHTEIGFWQYFNNGIRTFANSYGKTNFFQFGEVLDGSDGKCGYYTGTKAGGAPANDSVLDYPLYFKMDSALTTAGGNTRQLEDRFSALNANNYSTHATTRLVTFLDNHDQWRFMHPDNANNDTNKLSLAISFLYSAMGIPCLYYGTEQNFNGGQDPLNREDMFHGQYEQGPSLGDNFNMTMGSFQHVAKLNNFRRLYPTLRRGTHVNLWSITNGPGLFAYARRLGNEEVFVTFNTSSGNIILPNRPTINSSGTVLINLLNTNEKVTVVAGIDGIPPINVPSGQAKLFISESLWKPLDPVVIAQIPSHGVSNVVATNSIVLTFSKPMDTNSVQNAFSVTPPAGGSFIWSANRTVMTYKPSLGFIGSTTLVVRVNTNAFDTSSTNYFYAPFETFFRTAPASYTDAVPPTVFVQTPGSSLTVTGDLTITGTAADNASVQKVEVRINGGGWITATGTTTWSYSIDTRNFLNGSHSIAARSLDSSGNLSSNAAVTVKFFNVPGEYVQRINSGGLALTDCNALAWAEDQPYVPGSFGWISGTNGYIGNVISNICAEGQLLYQQERYSVPGETFRYVFDCPEGVYESVILETETFHTGIGERQFDLYIQGERMLADFDIINAAGGMNIPVILVFTNTVADSKLELQFVPRQNNSRVSAVQVTRIGDADSDSDGIPNWWMRGWFDHPTGQDVDESNAWDDPDEDGYNNGEEFVAMTSPVDGMSFPFVLNISALDNAIVSIPTATGRFYHLEWKQDISATDDWKIVEGDVPGIGGEMDLIDTNETDRGTYRVRISLP